MGIVTVAIELFCLAADIECFFVDHVHVEEEGEIVVRVGVCVIDKDALLEVFHCLGVITNLEV